MSGDSIVISDTNILFDILSAGLMEAFCELPYRRVTSDFVFREIRSSEQFRTVYNKTKLGKMEIISFPFEEILFINDLRQKESCRALSITDCSVWYLSRKLNGRLLSGDRKLRSVAEADGIKVSGILYVFDEVVRSNLISPEEAARKLQNLMKNNPRLPVSECNQRLDSWRRQ